MVNGQCRVVMSSTHKCNNGPTPQQEQVKGAKKVFLKTCQQSYFGGVSLRKGRITCFICTWVLLNIWCLCLSGISGELSPLQGQNVPHCGQLLRPVTLLHLPLSWCFHLPHRISYKTEEIAFNAMAVNGYFSIPTDTVLAEVDPQQILRVAICEK